MRSSERLCHGTDVGKASVYRGGCSHSGADQVRAPAVALPAFEVAVGSGGAALARSEAVGVHGEAHRAARFAPFETGVDEDFVQAFLFRLSFNQAGTGNN